jgi:putative nucleotidyltransferase with HDIG domain
MGDKQVKKMGKVTGHPLTRRIPLAYLLFIHAVILSFYFVLYITFSHVFSGGVVNRELFATSIPFAALGVLMRFSFLPSEALLGGLLTVVTANFISGISPLISLVGGFSLLSGYATGKYADLKGSMVKCTIFGSLLQVLFSSLLWYAFRGEAFTGTVLLSSLLAVVPGIGLLFLFLYLGEELFRISSPLKLMELCSESSPLLKVLREKAPGTFYHSINTAFIAEEGAIAMGANQVLCRVGGLYHDIGKVWKPEYYSENQFDTDNVHDTVSKDVSRFIIISHIDEGIKLAKKYRLGREVEDIMRTHHGNAPLYYYGSQKGKTPDRYPGPIPGTKEQVIVMLADGAEAVARSLREITEKELGRVVKYVINRAVSDGQLAKVDLGTDAISSLEEAVFRSLKVIYHNRIFYPSKGGFEERGQYDENLREKLPEKEADKHERTEGDAKKVPGDPKYH